MTVVLFKTGVAVVLMLLAYSIVSVTNREKYWISGVPAEWLPLVLAAAVRILLFAAVYTALQGAVPSDVPDYHYPQAKAALSGGVWNVDFQSTYSPLFPYLGAVLIVVFDYPIIFVLFALILDLVILLFWTDVYSITNVKRSTDVSIVYACSAPVILNAMVGQAQVWIGAGLAISAWLIICRTTSFYSGVVQGVTLCVTKILALLFWPVLIAISDKRLVWALAAITPPAVTVFVFSHLGANFLDSIRPEQKDFSSGNMVYYVDYFLGFGSVMPWIYDIFTAISLCGATVVAVYLICITKDQTKTRKAEEILLSSALMLATLLLTSKKSYANYLAFAYFPFIYVLYQQLSRRSFWILCSLLSVTGSVQASLWFAQGGKGYWLREWAAKVGWNSVLPSMLVELTLLAIYTSIIWLSIRGLRDLASLDRISDQDLRPRNCCPP